MLRMDDPEVEEVGVDQVFDVRMKRAIAVLQALLDYYRVKKVPPIATVRRIDIEDAALAMVTGEFCLTDVALRLDRSEEHTSELQSRLHLVCRLLLEKKK